MRQRLIYLMKVFMLTMVIFIAAKLVFMLVNYEGHAFGVSDVVAVIAHGRSPSGGTTACCTPSCGSTMASSPRC